MRAVDRRSKMKKVEGQDISVSNGVGQASMLDLEKQAGYVSIFQYALV